MHTALQHGEVILINVSKMPKGQTERVTKQIVAHSETGHHHVIESKTEFEVFTNADKQDLYLRLFEPAHLVHKKSTDKHRTLEVQPGIWKILHKTEYDPFAGLVKQVQD